MDRTSDTAMATAELLNGTNLELAMEQFRKFPELFEIIDIYMADSRMRVRLAATSVVEELLPVFGEKITSSVKALIPLLNHSSHLVRGDAINLLAVIDAPGNIEWIKKMAKDPDAQVREVALDILAEMEGS